VLRQAGGYLRARPTDIALTDSTTMGLGLLYGGLDLRAGQEVLTTTHDFYATHEALRLAAGRSGATMRRVALYRDPARATESEIVDSLARGRPEYGRRRPDLGALRNGCEAPRGPHRSGSARPRAAAPLR
jgi:hypothetical protein